MVVATSGGGGGSSGASNGGESLGQPATVTWTDASMDETRFKVERSPAGGGSFVQVGTAAANATSFIDASAVAGVTYEYRVFATNAGGDSAPSDVATRP